MLLLGIQNSFDENSFAQLLNQFVIKTNHDSARYVICRNKAIFDLAEAQKKLNKNLKRNYFWMDREQSYKNIKPKLLVETYMKNSDDEDLNEWSKEKW